MNMSIYDLHEYWFVNDRFKIYKDVGVVYDTDQADDIPQGIFAIRDRLMTYNNPTKGK